MSWRVGNMVMRLVRIWGGEDLLDRCFGAVVYLGLEYEPFSTSKPKG